MPDLALRGPLPGPGLYERHAGVNISLSCLTRKDSAALTAPDTESRLLGSRPATCQLPPAKCYPRCGYPNGGPVEKPTLAPDGLGQSLICRALHAAGRSSDDGVAASEGSRRNLILRNGERCKFISTLAAVCLAGEMVHLGTGRLAGGAGRPRSSGLHRLVRIWSHLDFCDAAPVRRPSHGGAGCRWTSSLSTRGEREKL